mgnify:CR=1 FL=1
MSAGPLDQPEIVGSKYLNEVIRTVRPKYVIEVDGCYWHKCKECGYGNGRPRDRSRNAYIRACGFRLEIIREHEL